MPTPFTSRFRKFQRSKKALVLCFVASVVFLYVYWIISTNFMVRDFWDPQYASKAAVLRNYIRQHPGKPMLVCLGSSKVDYGVRPDVVQDWSARPGNPELFNFGMSGSDLFREWLTLRRLVADGLKPQGVCIEILPILLCKKDSLFIYNESLSIRGRPGELPQYYRYAQDVKSFRSAWYQSRLNPAYPYGIRTENQTLPLTWLLPLPGMRHSYGDRTFDAWGWPDGIPQTTTQERYNVTIERCRQLYMEELKDYKVSAISRQAVEDMLAFCKEQHIAVTLIIMPQPAEFDSCAPPDVRGIVTQFAEEYRNRGIKVIDARDWITSKISYDKFLDGLHLLAPGAEEFTKRLVTELDKGQ